MNDIQSECFEKPLKQSHLEPKYAKDANTTKISQYRVPAGSLCDNHSDLDSVANCFRSELTELDRNDSRLPAVSPMFDLCHIDVDFGIESTLWYSPHAV